MSTQRRSSAHAATAIGAAAVIVIAAVSATPLMARLSKPIPHACDPVASPCLAVRNEFVRADISPAGSWAMGTTGGDPSTPLDDDKTMVYGFKPGGTSDVGSSYTTIRVSGPSGALDILPATSDVAAQIDGGDAVHTVWSWSQPHSVRVTETLRLADNPFSGRHDAVAIDYQVANADSVSVDVGVRALIDVKLHRNDGAPYIVPGVGAVTTEREFLAGDVPPFWQAFESPTYDPRELRSVGILDGRGVAVPDRFIIVHWLDILDQLWDYPIDTTKPITLDSAVALYWQPRTLAPGEAYTVTTAYGLAGDRGGAAFLSGPVNAECGATIPVSLFVTNFDTTPLTGGSATLTLDPGVALAPGESAAKPIPDIAPGATGSVVWQVLIGAASRGSFLMRATAQFDADRRFDAQYTVRVTCPDATATVPPPTAAPTPTVDPAGQAACDFILNRVPKSVIDAALANPDTVAGWNQLANPSAPQSPYNQPRRQLSLRNIGVPFHGMFNPVVYKAGCP
jgi:hypothetical protein